MMDIIDDFLRDFALKGLAPVGNDGYDKEYLLKKRKDFISYWKGNSENYPAQDKNLKMNQLGTDIFTLSLFDDKEILDLMKTLEVGEDVTQYFLNLEDLYKSVLRFTEKSKFNWNIRDIMGIYYPYRASIIMHEFWLDLGNTQNDMDTFLRGLTLREKKGKLYDYELNQRNLLEEVLKLSDETNLDTLRPRIDRGLSHGFRKIMNFSHKFTYYNMYYQSFKLNKNIFTSANIESDFKVDFFDLADLTIMDKKILWGKEGEDLELTYGPPGNRRFKIKRVEQLFLNLSENYSK
ncbi:MAG: hypothetical protein Tsb0033_18820 [Winogradskyella sp.]